MPDEIRSGPGPQRSYLDDLSGMFRNKLAGPSYFDDASALVNRLMSKPSTLQNLATWEHQNAPPMPGEGQQNLFGRLLGMVPENVALAANFISPGVRAPRPMNQVNALLDRASSMPAFKPDFSIRGLFDKQMRPPGYVEAEPFALPKVSELGREVTEVPTRQIRTTQPSVSVNAIRDKLANPVSDDGRPPSVFQWGDQYYVNDGNHRVSAAKLRDVDSILAEVIRLGEKPSPQGAPAQGARLADPAAVNMGAAPVDQGQDLARVLRRFGLMAGGTAAASMGGDQR